MGGAFEKELSSLGRSRQKKNHSGKVLPDWAPKSRSSTRHFPVQSPSKFYREKSSLSNGDHRDRAASTNLGNPGRFVMNCVRGLRRVRPFYLWMRWNMRTWTPQSKQKKFPRGMIHIMSKFFMLTSSALILKAI